MNITGNNVKLVTVDNDDWDKETFCVIDDKIALSENGIGDIIKYTSLTNHIAIRNYYRDLADNNKDKKSLSYRFKRFIDDAFDPNNPKQKQLFKDLNNWIFFWKDGEPSQQPLSKEQLAEIIDDLVKGFNTKKKLHDLSNKYGYAYLVGDTGENNIRNLLLLNDKHVRKQYGIPKEQSIVDKIVTVK